MKPTVLMDKAARAVASAKLLLDAGDVDGACNRAYPKSFDGIRSCGLFCFTTNCLTGGKYDRCDHKAIQ